MKLEVASACDLGQVRECNEDQLLVDDDLQLFAVCDGLGAHSAGEIASQLATKLLSEYLLERRAEIAEAATVPAGHFRLLSLLEAATQHACQRIHARTTDQPELHGMATTLTALLVLGSKGLMAHVGDSRLYLLRNEQLHQLSVDHTFAAELLARGEPAESIEAHHHHVLTRCVGYQSSVQVDTLLFDLLPGDRCLICSDGLNRHLPDRELAGVLGGGDDASSTVRQLVNQANEQGGEDNITVVLLDVPGSTVVPEDQRDLASRLDAVSSSPFFKGLALSSLNRIVHACEQLEFEPGAIILQKQDECPGLFMILRGQVEIERVPSAVISLGTYQQFGELSLTTPRAAAATVRASGRTAVLVLRRDAFRKLTRRFPRLGSAVLRRLAETATGAARDAADRLPEPPVSLARTWF